jgi:tetratricopeptide (TPR) repeat protein
MYFKAERLVECEQQFQEALRIFKDLGHRARIAEVLSRLGDVSLTQGQLAEAECLYRESEGHAEGINRPKTRAYNLLGFARIAYRRGDCEAAREYARQARETFGNLGIADEAAEMADLPELLGQ